MHTKDLQPLQCFERKKHMLLMLHCCWDDEYAARLFIYLENTTVSHIMHKGRCLKMLSDVKSVRGTKWLSTAVLTDIMFDIM